MIGSKELVAWLPTLLGGPRRRRLPALAYPTYDVGARLAGATAVVVDAPSRSGRGRSPCCGSTRRATRPGGCCLPEHLRRSSAGPGNAARSSFPTSVTWSSARETEPVSVLHPDVCDGDHDGVLAVHSLSKRSNLAGYRAGFVAGDPALVARLLEMRKHAGMMVPAPMQAAMIAALGDDEHVAEQRERYAAAARPARRQRAAGFPSTAPRRACTCGPPATRTAGRPSTGSPSAGSSWRPASSTATAGARHVRIALTATDERVAAAASRLMSA